MLKELAGLIVDFLPNVLNLFKSLMSLFRLFFEILPGPFDSLFTVLFSLIFGFRVYRLVQAGE